MPIDIGTLLSSATSIIGNIDQAISAAKTLRALIKEKRYPQELVDQLVALSLDTTDAKLKMAELSAELLTLQDALNANEEIKQRKRDYVLTETPGGAHVYALKTDADCPPYVCPECFECDKIRILQPLGRTLDCKSCKSIYSRYS